MTTILVVDDEAPIVDLVRFTLEDAEVRVVEASDGAEALVLARRIKPDLVLLDVHMPRLDGLEVCRQLTQGPATRHIPVILISAKASQISGEQVAAAGAFASLQKPYDPSDLRQRMQAALRETGPVT